MNVNLEMMDAFRKYTGSFGESLLFVIAILNLSSPMTMYMPSSYPVVHKLWRPKYYTFCFSMYVEIKVFINHF